MSSWVSAPTSATSLSWLASFADVEPLYRERRDHKKLVDVLDVILNVIVDGGNNYAWERVALPGAKCGNGSQYKFFLRRTRITASGTFFKYHDVLLEVELGQFTTGIADSATAGRNA